MLSNAAGRTEDPSKAQHPAYCAAEPPLLCGMGAKGFLRVPSHRMHVTLLGLMPSMSLSSEGIQLGARWQFWKKTQFPCSIALCIMASARGPCGGR